MPFILLEVFGRPGPISATAVSHEMMRIGTLFVDLLFQLQAQRQPRTVAIQQHRSDEEEQNANEEQEYGTQADK